MKKQANGHRKQPRGAFVYRSYSFKDKDPVIDRIRTMVKDEGLSYGEIHVISGVSDTTLRNWFDGETKKPQYATIAAVTSSLGYTQKFVKEKRVDYERELEKARKEIEQAASRK